MNQEQPKGAMEEGAEKGPQAIAQRAKEAFFNSIAGETFTTFNPDTLKEYKNIATGNFDSAGYAFVKEDGAENSTVISKEMILKSPEGKTKIEEILAQEQLSEEEKEAAMKLLGI